MRNLRETSTQRARQLYPDSKNNSRRITYGIGCVWGMPFLSPLSSLASTESIEVYCPSYLCQSAAIFTATLFYRGLFQRPCKYLRLSYHYMLIARRRRLSYRSSQLTNDHDFLWKAPVAQNVSQPMSCLNR